MDEVVCAVPYRDYVLIFMASGKILQMRWDDNTPNGPTFKIIGEVPGTSFHSPHVDSAFRK